MKKSDREIQKFWKRLTRFSRRHGVPPATDDCRVSLLSCVSGPDRAAGAALAPGLTTTMFHRCCPSDHDVPSWSLLLRAGAGFGVAGRARGAHGSTGQYLSSASGMGPG